MPDENIHTHREAWLKAVIRRLAPMFREWGHPVPFNIRVTCGFPSTRPLAGQRNQRIGECWYADASKDSHVEIMISPVLDDPMRVAGVLAHELIHAACGPEVGHKGPSRSSPRSSAWKGKMTATTEGEAFKQFIQPILDDIGPYPHAALNARKRSSGPRSRPPGSSRPSATTAATPSASPRSGSMRPATRTARNTDLWSLCDDPEPTPTPRSTSGGSTTASTSQTPPSGASRRSLEPAQGRAGPP
jgi:hypothetical protein